MNILDNPCLELERKLMLEWYHCNDILRHTDKFYQLKFKYERVFQKEFMSDDIIYGAMCSLGYNPYRAITV